MKSNTLRNIKNPNEAFKNLNKPKKLPKILKILAVLLSEKNIFNILLMIGPNMFLNDILVVKFVIA